MLQDVGITKQFFGCWAETVIISNTLFNNLGKFWIFLPQNSNLLGQKMKWKLLASAIPRQFMCKLKLGLNEFSI